jgi:hypothetical protein
MFEKEGSLFYIYTLKLPSCYKEGWQAKPDGVVLFQLKLFFIVIHKPSNSLKTNLFSKWNK